MRRLSTEQRRALQDDTPPELLPPVRWGVSRDFLAGLRETLLYTFFPERLDPRDWMRAEPLIEPVGPDGVWFDYLSDTGDSGHAVATLGILVQGDLVTDGGLDSDVTLPTRHDPTAPNPVPETLLPWGTFLIIGGDTAYSIATEKSIGARFAGPWNWARCLREALGPSRDQDITRHLYGIPGNHDWYDSLDGFNRLFRRRDDPTRPALDLEAYDPIQDASYFSIVFPVESGIDWRIDGVDAARDQIDTRQRRFFAELDRHDPTRGPHRIIVTPEPARRFDEDAPWYLDGGFDGYPLPPREHRHASLLLSGDIHHYARYAGRDATETIVQCGLGGALVHPTHLHPGAFLPDGESGRVRRLWPAPQESRDTFRWHKAMWSVRAWIVGLALGLLLGLGPAGLECTAEVVALAWDHVLVWSGLGLTIWAWSAWPPARMATSPPPWCCRIARTAFLLAPSAAAFLIAELFVHTHGGARQLFIELVWHLIVIAFVTGLYLYGAGSAAYRNGPSQRATGLLGLAVGIAVAYGTIGIAAAFVLYGPAPQLLWALVAATAAGSLLSTLGLAVFIRYAISMGALRTDAGAFARDDSRVAFLRCHLTRDGLEVWAIGAETTVLTTSEAKTQLPRAKIIDHFVLRTHDH